MSGGPRTPGIGISKTAADGTYLSVLRPSGDTTGAADIAAINAATLAGRYVQLTGPVDGTVGVFYINSPILQRSGRTLHLINAEVRLVAGANCNLVTDDDHSTVTTDWTIRGTGRALFNGQGSLQTRPNLPNLAVNCGFYFVNVARFTVRDIQIGPTNAYTAIQYGATDGLWQNIGIEQDKLTANQDGIDVGIACSNIKLDNIYGVTGDDGFAIHGIRTWTSGATHATPTQYASGTGYSTHDINATNYDLDVGSCPIRLALSSPCSVYNVTVEGYRNRNIDGNNSFVQIGSATYTDATDRATAGQLSNIRIANIFGGARFGSGFVLCCDDHVTDIEIDGVNLNKKGWRQGIVGNFDAAISPTVSKVTIRNLHSSYAAASTEVGDMVKFLAGATVSDVVVENAHLGSCKSVLNNAVAVTNLKLANIRIGKAWATPFLSSVAETGYINGVSIDSVDGAVTKTYQTAMATRLKSVPQFVSTDTVPVAVAGSDISCAAGFDPTGHAFAFAAAYVADGTTWRRTSRFEPDSWSRHINVFAPLLASVGTWAFNQQSLAIFGGFRQNTSKALNDQADFSVSLGEGTWTVNMLFAKTTDGAIATVQLDDGAGSFTTIGTVDTYNGSTVYTGTGSPGSVTIAAGAAVPRTLRVKAASRNASNTTAYSLNIGDISFQRTA